eukprot:1487972-Prymnesium_polylepis.2
MLFVHRPLAGLRARARSFPIEGELPQDAQPPGERGTPLACEMAGTSGCTPRLSSCSVAAPPAFAISVPVDEPNSTQGGSRTKHSGERPELELNDDALRSPKTPRLEGDADTAQSLTRMALPGPIVGASAAGADDDDDDSDDDDDDSDDDDDGL